MGSAPEVYESLLGQFRMAADQSRKAKGTNRRNNNMESDIVDRTNLTCPECSFVEELDIPLDY